MDNRTRTAIIGSSHAMRKYRNRRDCARIFDPQPAAGGFPYNRRSVAECDPLAKRYKAQDFGYDA
jgi:hypothetical protein